MAWKRASIAGVEYIIVGGVAAGIHGALRMTLDLDVVYRRTPNNIDRLTSALAGTARVGGNSRVVVQQTGGCGPGVRLRARARRLYAPGGARRPGS